MRQSLILMAAAVLLGGCAASQQAASRSADAKVQQQEKRFLGVLPHFNVKVQQNDAGLQQPFDPVVSLDSLAQLPPWLVPPPAGSTPVQAKQWQRAQQKALANATRPPGKVKVKNAGNSTYTLKQREKLNLYDRSKQQSKQKNDQRDQTQQKADLRHKEKPVTKTGLQLPAGFWLALALGLVGLIVWLVVRFTARSALR